MDEKIVEISAKLFYDRGIRAVSMDDVSQALGMSKRTLYEHFSSKEDLLVKCLEWTRQKGKDAHKSIGDDGGDVVQIFMRHLYFLIMQLKQVSIAFLQDITRIAKPSVSSKYEEEKMEDYCRMRELFLRGQKEGFIRSDVNVELILGIFMEQGESVKELYATGKFTMEEIFINIYITYFRGICTPKGIERVDVIMKENEDKLLKNKK
ncbi:MAG: TetR/AcrR family transcriptional regulator [Bacteroidales bacterium]|nr:TetR/AcrR family transcriptional regulator [Bacteroidales bacterium]